MKQLLFSLLFAFCAITCLAQSSLQHEHFVDDYAALFSRDQANDLAESIKSFWDTAQIAIVTVKSLEGRDIQEYSTALFNQWGIGDRKKNNGLLLLISPSDHKAFAATGTGIQGYVTDLMAARLQRQYLVPEAKKGNYYEGTRALLTAYMGILRPMANEVRQQELAPDYSCMCFLLILITPIGLFLIYFRRRALKKREAEKERLKQSNQDSVTSYVRSPRSYGVGSGGYSSGGYVSSSPSTSYDDSISSSYSSSSSNDSSSYSSSSSSDSNSSSYDFGGGSNDGGGGGSDW